ncbi:MAG TPA: flagellar basal body rod protein FlgC [Fimbriimonadaceae bacterium]|nr:flagellar basal body rod protein FlgC [Fimbriimonadaceae bacterium]
MRISNTLSHAMKVSSTGLYAERTRMDVISSNIANAHSMKIGNADPYRRKDVALSGGPDGVKVTRIVEDRSAFRIVNDPNNPNADGQGNVTYSNVDPLIEMVNMIGASRAYEANVAAFNSTKGMIRAALQIGRI